MACIGWLTDWIRDSFSEIRRLIRQNDALLQEIAANTRDLRRTHAVDAPASILSKDEDNGSIFSQLVDTKDDDTSFETVILGTKVYSNAFAGALNPTGDDQSDDARTIVDTPVHYTVPTTASQPALRTSELALHAPQIKRSIDCLGIVDICAITQVDYNATLDEELGFQKGQYIDDIQKLTESRYQGRLPSTGLQGHFDRTKVLLYFTLRQPLEVHTIAAYSNTPNDKFLTFQKGDILKIKASPELSQSRPQLLTNIQIIGHSFAWQAEIQQENNLRGKKEGFVFLSDLDLGYTLEQDVNQVLEFFSCPMPALASLNKREQRRQMREIIERGSNEEWHALRAHCSSVEELRYVASLYRRDRTTEPA